MSIPNYAADFEKQYEFVQIGTITGENAVLGVDGRANQAVKDIVEINKVIYRPDDGTAAIVGRFRVDGTENDEFAVHIYAAKGSDYYTRVATLACIQGTQDWSGGHFVDSITISNEYWAPGIRVDAPGNEIGRFYINTAGYDRFLFLSPDLTDDDIDTLHVDIARADKRIDGDTYSAIINMAGGIDLSDLNSVITAGHATLEASLDSIETDIEANTAHLDSAVNFLDSIETDVEAANVFLDSIETDIETANTHLDSAVNFLDSIETDIEAGNIFLDSIEADIEANTAHLDSAVNELQSVKGDTAATTNHLDSAVNFLDSIETDIEATNTTLDSVNNNLDSIKADTAAETGHLDSAVNELQSIKGDTAGLEASLDSIETDVELTNTTLDSALNELNSIKGDTAAIETSLDSIETDIELTNTTLDSAVNELQSVKGDTAAATNHLNSAVNFLDSIETDIEATNTTLDSVVNELQSIKGDTSPLNGHLDSAVNELQSVKGDTAAMANHLDSAVDAIDEASGHLDSAVNELQSIKADVTANTNHLDSVVNTLDSIYANMGDPVWVETHSFLFSSGGHAEVTSAIALNGVVRKVVVEIPTCAAANPLSKVTIDDAQGVEIFKVSALAESADYTYNVDEPLQGTITIGVDPSLDPGEAWSVVVTLRGI